MIRPHGGRLINRLLDGDEKEAAQERTKSLPQARVEDEILQDAENIAKGVFSPLEGFLSRSDLESVLSKDRLKDDTPWTIPILLDVDESDARRFREGEDVALAKKDGEPAAILHLEEKYTCDKENMALSTFGTTDRNHPGVEGVYRMKDMLLGGKISLFREMPDPFKEYNLTPEGTRAEFEKRGWRTTVAFQTRNVPHGGHENLQKTVLGLVDGLLIQPVIGKKKKGDFKDEIIIETYKVLIENYFAKDRVLLNILPFRMRYAGPKEAIFHAIVRKNYGCTHIIIGRDHAGVGDYYHPEAAIEIFDEYDDLEIQPITIRGDFFYCTVCRQLSSDRTCPHEEDKHINFSGTAIRKSILEGRMPPQEIMRPDVFDALSRSSNPFVE